METKANFTLIGAATLAGVALLMLFALWLANGEYRRGFSEYDIVFNDPVRGLAEGGEVRFNGIKLGEVRDLRIDRPNNNRVIARVRISRDVVLRTDSTARLEPIGLTGVTLIQLSPGQGSELRPGFGSVPRIAGYGSQIDVVLAQSEDIVREASEAMASVRRLLTDDNIARINRTLANLETISAQLADRRSVVSRSGETAAALRDASNNIATLAAQTQRDLDQLDTLVAETEAAAAVASSETLPELTRAADDMRRAAQAVANVADSMSDDPSQLLQRQSRPTVELNP